MFLSTNKLRNYRSDEKSDRQLIPIQYKFDMLGN